MRVIALSNATYSQFVNIDAKRSPLDNILSALFAAVLVITMSAFMLGNCEFEHGPSSSSASCPQAVGLEAHFNGIAGVFNPGFILISLMAQPHIVILVVVVVLLCVRGFTKTVFNIAAWVAPKTGAYTKWSTIIFIVTALTIPFLGPLIWRDASKNHILKTNLVKQDVAFASKKALLKELVPKILDREQRIGSTPDSQIKDALQKERDKLNERALAMQDMNCR